MPALITHYLFGEEALNRGACLGTLDHAASGDPRRTAFDLGCQGPDPLFYGYTTLRGPRIRDLAHQMHVSKVSSMFEQLRRGVESLSPAEQPVGQAFACGMLTHYALDRRAHAYVFAHQYEIIDNAPELAKAHHEVHALIESEIDSGMLDHYRGLRTASFAPVSVLEGNAQVERVAGALLANVAREVYKTDLRTGDYSGCLADARLVYRLIEPHGSARSQRIAGIERRLHEYSLLGSLAHRNDLGMEGNASMNASGHAWTDPRTGTVSHEPFTAVFERALDEYAQLVEVFLSGAPMRGHVAGINYDGKSMDEHENALP